MDVHKLNFGKNKALYLSLREQYLSDRPMSESEVKTMWDTWYYLTTNGYKWFRIKSSQIRK